ncbi:hypothetical protein AMATHDRAFT_45507 [Amanita thiersii Skay4041]|uniref:Uncharacterized protein n=1 Tax=Amanita thiersii Skay4041 TaxID=703135 RepID=A0A2A9NXP2_9AGAR|nr:hypothetical protein AMATHDRAFT_45507 [Amanita thiersii Skay4041]
MPFCTGSDASQPSPLKASMRIMEKKTWIRSILARGSQSRKNQNLMAARSDLVGFVLGHDGFVPAGCKCGFSPVVELTQDEWQFHRAIIRCFLRDTRDEAVRLFDHYACSIMKGGLRAHRTDECYLGGIYQYLFGSYAVRAPLKNVLNDTLSSYIVPRIEHSSISSDTLNNNAVKVCINEAIHDKLMQHHGCPISDPSFLTFLVSLSSGIFVTSESTYLLNMR